MPHQRHAAPAEVVHEGEQVRGEVLGGIRGRRGPCALAVTALIERDHVEPVGERRNYMIEPVRVRRAAMKETDGRRLGWPGRQIVQIQAVYADISMVRQLATESLTSHVT